ncbi:MAG: TetR family transcriptional regulator [Alphaproteobacteria bacterium]|nr:TetR family transcriptional regulator [Alphaproteobacteria bacterium]
MAAKTHSDKRLSAAKALMALLAEKSWQSISLSDVAAKAALSLADLRSVAFGKEALLSALGSDIDRQVLAGLGQEEADLSARDRLFDVLMRRIEALTPYKAAFRRLAREGAQAPFALLASACSIDRAMPWMLEAAGISSAGLAGRLKAKALAAVYLSAVRVWLGDDSADLGPTMGALDQALDRAERLIALLPLPLRSCLAGVKTAKARADTASGQT